MMTSEIGLRWEKNQCTVQQITSEVVWACEEKRPWLCGKIRPRNGYSGKEKERPTKTEMARLSSGLKDKRATEDKKRWKKLVSAKATHSNGSS